jgi:mono/diheme cytochrome c family protein
MKALTLGTRAAVLAAVLVMAGRDVPAQNGDSSGTPAPRSTAGGVYTAEQANRGRDIYAGLCTGCHTTASHTGGTFWDGYVGKRLSELFVYVSERMPKSDPGALAPDEYAALVAYILKLNGAPAGDGELPADSTVLKDIRIDGVKKEARESPIPRKQP